MQHHPYFSRLVGALVRSSAVGVLVLVLAAGLAATWGTSSPAGAAKSHLSMSASCAGVAGAHHARVVVEASRGKVVERCVGFNGATIPALKLLADSRLQLGTQKYSFGVAICQVDHVPGHYSQCLPSGKPYWALFLSPKGHGWTSPSVGVSDIKVPAGGSLGLRYDSPTGTPAPPPRPSPA